MRAVILAVALILVSCTSPEPSRTHIRFVIPDDYAPGKSYLLKADPVQGREPKTIDGWLVFELVENPANFKSLAVFDTWHRQEIITQSGKLIRGAEYDGDPLTDRTVTVMLSGASDGTYTLYINKR